MKRNWSCFMNEHTEAILKREICIAMKASPCSSLLPMKSWNEEWSASHIPGVEYVKRVDQAVGKDLSKQLDTGEGEERGRKGGNDVIRIK